MATYRNSTQKVRAPYGRTLCMYEIQTPDVVAGWIERCVIDSLRGRYRPVRVFYGDTDYPKFEEVHKRLPDPGMDWMEENDVIGHFGRSMGEHHIPLLVPMNEDGGPGLLDGCIVRLFVDGSEVWRHPNYRNPMDNAVIQRCQIETYRAEVIVNGEVHARFRSRVLAEAWLKFMRGESLVNPEGMRQ